MYRGSVPQRTSHWGTTTEEGCCCLPGFLVLRGEEFQSEPAGGHLRLLPEGCCFWPFPKLFVKQWPERQGCFPPPHSFRVLPHPLASQRLWEKGEWWVRRSCFLSTAVIMTWYPLSRLARPDCKPHRCPVLQKWMQWPLGPRALAPAPASTHFPRSLWEFSSLATCQQGAKRICLGISLDLERTQRLKITGCAC